MSRYEQFSEGWGRCRDEIISMVGEEKLSEWGGNSALQCSALVFIAGELAYLNDTLANLTKVIQPQERVFCKMCEDVFCDYCCRRTGKKA